jgi:hypothetical protein
VMAVCLLCLFLPSTAHSTAPNSGAGGRRTPLGAALRHEPPLREPQGLAKGRAMITMAEGAAASEQRGYLHVASPAQSARQVVDCNGGTAPLACVGCRTTLGAVEGLGGLNSLLGHCPSLIFITDALTIHDVAAPAVPVAEASPSAVALPPDPPPPKGNVKICA